MMKKLSVLLVFSMLVLVLASCQPKKDPIIEDDAFYLYYAEPGRAELIPVEAVFENDVNDSNMIYSVFTQMKNGADEANYRSVVPSELELLDYRLEEGNLILNFPSAYQDIEKKDELLLRAAIVKTFSQLDQVSSVEIRVEGQPLVIQGDYVVGAQRGSDFVDVLGNGLNTYKRQEVVLYFSDESGTALLPRTRTIVYSAASSLEQQVLNSLLAGPDAEDEEAFRTIPETVKTISVNTISGICYVNLSEAMLSENAGVSPEVCIYSMVDSLTALPGFNSVQLSINGSSNLIFMDRVDLSDSLRQNLDLIASEEDAE